MMPPNMQFSVPQTRSEITMFNSMISENCIKHWWRTKPRIGWELNGYNAGLQSLHSWRNYTLASGNISIPRNSYSRTPWSHLSVLLPLFQLYSSNFRSLKHAGSTFKSQTCSLSILMGMSSKPIAQQSVLWSFTGHCLIIMDIRRNLAILAKLFT